MASKEEQRAESLREIVKERLDTLSRVEIEKWVNELVAELDNKETDTNTVIDGHAVVGMDPDVGMIPTSEPTRTV